MTGLRLALPQRSRSSSAPRGPRALRGLPRPRAKVVAVAVVALALLSAGSLWLRDSSLVAVEHVKITGASGPDGRAIRRALTAAGRDMTTLHVRRDALRDAVSSFSVVKELRVSAQPLHGLSIQVVEYAAAAVVAVGDRRVAVAADGTILRRARPDGLPLVPARVLPGGDRLRDRQALAAVSVAGAAPAALRGLITRIRSGGRDGLRADLQGGLRIVFGSHHHLAAKWAAAARVLAHPKAAGAAYVDVRLPQRPVAGPFTSPSSTVSAGDGAAPAAVQGGAAPPPDAAITAESALQGSQPNP